jgi:hypothetical protein
VDTITVKILVRYSPEAKEYLVQANTRALKPRLTGGLPWLSLQASLEETGTSSVGAEGATAPESLRQKDHDAIHLESGTMACPPTG